MTQPINNEDAKTFALAAARIAQERHCTNVVVLDLKGQSPATDYFVIATGTSSNSSQYFKRGRKP